MIKVDPNKTCYVFDVDGTLTEHRREINLKFKNEFEAWAIEKQCFISTGSDYKKTIEQIGTTVNSFSSTFCCMSNEIRDRNGSRIYKSNFKIPTELQLDLDRILKNSKYPLRTGCHLEFRTGMLNFSVVGRNANHSQRSNYSDWDAENQERSSIVKFINESYPTLDASIGGGISVDIIETGCDKGQTVLVLEIAWCLKLIFIGDRCAPGGNDYGIIRELQKSNMLYEWYNVTGPKDTLSLLRTNKAFGGGK